MVAMIRNSVGREHSSRAIRLSTSIGVRRFARIEWSWKMRSNLSNDCSSAWHADANFKVRHDGRRHSSAGLSASLELSHERHRHPDPPDADVTFDERLEQFFREC